MKTKFSILSILFILFISITSCKKNEENANIKYDGAWTLTENCSPSGAASYSVAIVLGPADPLKFSVKGLWEVPASLTVCTINSGDKNIFFLFWQTISPSFEIEILSSNINTNGDIITINYRIYATGSIVISDACTATLTKI